MPYTEVKNKEKNAYTEFTYSDILANIVGSMFDYTGLPDSLPQEYLEQYLLVNGTDVEGGSVGIFECDNELICARAKQGGFPLDPYGRSRSSICTTRNGQSFEFKNSDDNFVLGFNNSRKTPDLIIPKVAAALTEADKSIRCQVFYARLFPVPIASDNVQKALIEDVFKSIFNGNFGVITSENTLKEIVNGSTAIETLNLTEVEHIDKLQYLTQYHETLLRWFLNLYGQAQQGTGKLAQQSVEEIDGTLSTSFLIPMDMLRCRKKMCDTYNKKFGEKYGEISVDFSEVWRIELEKLRSHDASTDAEPAQPEQDPEGDQDDEGGEDNE